ncbi:MAG: ubiquinol-cytochrome c reductase iron-sulfur subunit [Nitrospirae bacterium]|nr:ubiquinol-cytochrome c reductase iron-sulfur subunit [Nitrospirota bacterium]
MEHDSQIPEMGHVEATRRRFLKWLIAVLAAVNALIAGIPFLRSLLGPSVAAQKNEWSKVAAVDLLPQDSPVDMRFMAESGEAYLHNTVLRSVWVIKHSPEKISVFSPVCTHLGCYYQWNGQADRFECPCHASVFAPDGKVISGPAPRPLDTLESKIENGYLLVKWENFKAGVPTKIPVA